MVLLYCETYPLKDSGPDKNSPIMDGLFGILMMAGWGAYYATLQSHPRLLALSEAAHWYFSECLHADARNMHLGHGFGCGVATQRMSENFQGIPGEVGVQVVGPYQQVAPYPDLIDDDNIAERCEAALWQGRDALSALADMDALAARLLADDGLAGSLLPE